MLVLLFGALFPLAAAQFTSPDSIPNPRTNFRECKMRSIARVCDPQELLTESDRYRLNTGLTNMQTRSEGNMGTFCEKKGVDGYLVVVNQADQSFADSLLSKWHPDDQCGKSVVVVLSKNTNEIHVGGAKKAGLNENDLSALLSSQKEPIAQGRPVAAVESVLQGIAKMAAPAVTNQGTSDNRVPTSHPGHPDSAATIGLLSFILSLLTVVAF